MVRLDVAGHPSVAAQHEVQRPIEHDEMTLGRELAGQVPLRLAHPVLQGSQRRVRVGIRNGNDLPAPSAERLGQRGVKARAPNGEPLHAFALENRRPTRYGKHRARRKRTRQPAHGLPVAGYGYEPGFSAPHAVDKGQRLGQPRFASYVGKQLIAVLDQDALGRVSRLVVDEIGRAIAGAPILDVDPLPRFGFVNHHPHRSSKVCQPCGRFSIKCS